MNPDGTRNLDRQIGWFVGLTTKSNRIIIFAHYIEDQAKQDTHGGKRAKDATKEKLMELINSEQK